MPNHKNFVIVTRRQFPDPSDFSMINIHYYMAELVFRSVRKIMHSDCLLNSPTFYDIRTVQYAFYSGPIRIGGKISQLILIKFKN